MDFTGKLYLMNYAFAFIALAEFVLESI